jgi:NAD(P)-dependent dehydrogenase (short-subunit alcohol dehydrogenase family)
MKLKNKVAVITGAAGGIGRAVALRYASEGAMCAIVDVSQTAAQTVAGEIEAAGGNACVIAADLTQQSQIDAMVSAVTDRFRRLDILFNGAGVVDIQPVMEVTRERWDRVMDINLKGAFFVLQAVAGQMIEQGEGGKIINVASESGRRGTARAAPYCATKAGIISMTQSTALSLIAHGINVNAIAPGLIDTAMWDEVDRLLTEQGIMEAGEIKRRGAAETPYGRTGTPDDLIGAATFLASQDSQYIVGQTINIDGGRILS